MPTFTEPKEPTYSMSKTTGTRVIEAEFGDGYSQRAGDGLNAVFVKAELEWAGLTTAEADTVETFFQDRGGYEAFDYTLPRESTARKFICRDWRRQAVGPGHDTITTNFEEVFDL